MPDTYQRGAMAAVAENKVNKDPSRQKPLHQREAFCQNPSASHHLSSEPSGTTSHATYDDNSPVNSWRAGIKMKRSKEARPRYSQRDVTVVPGGTTWPPSSQSSYYPTQSSSPDFTSDNLPQNGAIIFDQNESSRSSQARREGPHRSATPALASGPVAPAPRRDYTLVMRQIRRALGVREPCRADREAKTQKIVARADKGPPSGASGPPVQYPQGSYASSAHSAASVSSIAPTKQTTVRTTKEHTHHHHHHKSVPSLIMSQRVRITRQPDRAQVAKFHPPSSGAGSKLTSSEMNEGMKKKRSQDG